ncbi:hypothetical protein C7974DRAFT_423057 [Boeremia exigua]|uniref:uncharacterized protein n=1 Tax=Boeremia exigua TaxID=749465 RepID=UPI001E8DB232|nr:uncharacterized protein C7974DRAFT_423057 [Boeremia exigua]KAH6638135.1 hypothetical protein C7974DRAFT_423057 [Boeremia exigua]
MSSGLPGPRRFRAAFVLWVFFVFTILLGYASATPLHHARNELIRRAVKPGIGVELEIRNINIVGPGKPLVGEKREAIKGAVMTPVGFAGAPKLNWALTAEVGESNILPEAIVDGIKNKVGDHQTKVIGDQIFQFFKGWAPCSAKGCKVKINGFDNLGEWSVKWPMQPIDSDKMLFGPQVTTAMPLGAVLKILADAKAKNTVKNPLASSGALDAARIKILTKADFASFKKISPSDIDDEFLGFFSLLTSYCVLAKFTDPKKGPKHLLPVMPRTDFVAQYTKFIEKKLTKQFLDKTTSLLDVVVKVSGNAQLAKEAFKWNTGAIATIPENWAGKANNIKTGKLEIDDFINHIQGFDKTTKKTLPKMDLLKLMDKTMRHGQIGSLNNKMELVLDSTKEAPIFEFRELDYVHGAKLGTTLGTYEDKVIAYHKQFKKRSINDQEDVDASQE